MATPFQYHDVTVVGPGAAYVDGDLASPAAVAIEILSPDQEISDLFTKAGKIFKSGTSFVVILWPESQRCWTYTSNDVTEDTGRSVRAFKAYELEVSLPTMWASLLGPV